MTCNHVSMPCTACGAGFTKLGRDPLPGERDMTGDEFVQWREHNVRRALVEQNARFREALMSIASLSDGPVVCGGFDEPGSAEVARKALAAGWIGPCVHGRDPWDRCDVCGELDEEVAWAMAAIKERAS